MIRLIAILIGAVLTVGCTAVKETQPARTATEQLILSHAVIDAMQQIKADEVTGKKVMLDLSYLKTVDIEFAKGELRNRLLQLGAELVADIDMAEIIVEARSSGLGIDDSKTMIGIPAIPVPIPSVGIFKTPALPLYKYDKQLGIAGLSFTGIEVATGKHVFSVGPIIGNAVHSDMSLIGIPLHKNRKYLDR